MTYDPVRNQAIRKLREGAKRYPEFGALFFAFAAVSVFKLMFELGKEVIQESQNADLKLFILSVVLFLFAAINMIYYTVLAVRKDRKK